MINLGFKGRVLTANAYWTVSEMLEDFVGNLKYFGFDSSYKPLRQRIRGYIYDLIADVFRIDGIERGGYNRGEFIIKNQNGTITGIILAARPSPPTESGARLAGKIREEVRGERVEDRQNSLGRVLQFFKIPLRHPETHQGEVSDAFAVSHSFQPMDLKLGKPHGDELHFGFRELGIRGLELTQELGSIVGIPKLSLILIRAEFWYFRFFHDLFSFVFIEPFFGLAHISGRDDSKNSPAEVMSYD